MEPDTLAVIAVLGVLLVAGVILGFLLQARRTAHLREEIGSNDTASRGQPDKKDPRRRKSGS